ncbi:hypothetical protein L5515_014987 [Caenorhabditis briggsae]|uniref:Uncharacterized protein n=1 Tax=Caenorhabditis briggsae TaxID=6238 RepID=A0AAE9ECW5_CAEBR|nr:hypothetical protein L3Y34_018866 [Caenorhabditis briggsae]UMM19339.1 hypothetical protein L5515_014987 [Caenorhabditis briggsae]
MSCLASKTTPSTNTCSVSISSPKATELGGYSFSQL